ncbi:MAG: DUF2071 domain-containing protein [Myxococcota bacterium]
MESIALTALANVSLDDRRAFFTAHWSSILLLNYEADPEVLKWHVPAGCELDLYRGRCLVSVVGLWLSNTRIHGIKVPLHSDFEEVNLRYYVRVRVHGEWRRGVVFIKELVPKAAVAFVARAVYNENYHATKMRHTRPSEPIDRAVGDSVAYYWRQDGAWNELRGTIADRAIVPEAGTEAWFVTDHTRGYVTNADRTTLEYEVEHPPWAVAPVTDARLHCDVERLYGKRFVSILEPPPVSAFMAVGSDVSIYPAAVVRRSPDNK